MSGTYQVQPPEPFSFSRPNEWPKWARRFERFRVASGLVSKGEEVQVNTLLYAMGDDTDDILRSFQLSAADQKKYSEVKGRFDQHFVKKRNVIFERARFKWFKQKVGTNVFEWEKSNYLLVVDYQSRWIEIVRLPQTTSRSIVNHMSSIFARYGIPELVVSDKGPQYSSECFKEFGRAVQTIKGLLKKAPDPYMALLAYRATLLALGYTPSELLMGRKLRTTVPMTRELRKPAVPNLEEVAERDRREKQRQTDNFNASSRS